ncbi:MAG: hypothetical protein LBI33_11055 [Propionibacteriaceae bacterium]|jgi:hypothetical protein|nr:hypothetical protein [Propionibacteriaceae bacterium]
MSDIHTTDDQLTPGPQRAEEAPKKKKRVGGILITVLAAVLIVGGVYGIGGSAGWWPWPFGGSTPGGLVNAPRDLEGNIVVPEDESALSPEFMKAAGQVDDDGGEGFIVPTLDLQVALGSINAVNGSMNPSNFKNVFWVRNMGVSLDKAETGTVYLVTHAIQGGKAPGNILQSGGQVALKPGDLITVNHRTYVFESASIISKSDKDDNLGTHDELWTNDPGRLVLVTCLLNPHGGLAVDNLVIIAKLQS